MSKTAVVWDERYLLQDTGPGHPERPERLEAIRQVLEKKPVGKMVERLEPRLATVEEIALVHEFEYVKKIEKTANRRLL